MHGVSTRKVDDMVQMMGGERRLEEPGLAAVR